MTTRAWRTSWTAVLALGVVASSGCLGLRTDPIPSIPDQPKELSKITQPEHMIEPPDVLQIDLIAAVPKPPYKLQPLDALSLRATGVLPDRPLAGIFQIDTDGTLNLGDYGIVPIAGKTVPEAKTILLDMLKKSFVAPELQIALAQSRGMQQVRGPHLVRPDGTVWFETYGAVRIVGMTLPQAQAAIEAHLSQFFLEPKVAMSITGYNSKVFYVIFDSQFGGAGSVFRLPVTGNETVLDVMAQVGGMSQQADYKRIWIARPAPAGSCPQILPIDWKAITEKADVATNYQLLAGDRIFVKTAPMVTLSARIDRFLQPFEQIIGFALLIQGIGQNGNNNNSNR